MQAKCRELTQKNKNERKIEKELNSVATSRVVHGSLFRYTEVQYVGSLSACLRS